MPNSILISVVLLSVAIAWFLGLFFLVLTYKNWRFWRSHHRLAPPMLESYQRVSLFIPCKGIVHRLRENLTAFVQQDHPNFDVSFVVESENDAAVNLIRNLMRENRHVRCRLVVAGIARDSGQRVHNLRFATRRLDPQTEVLVFADSDVCPPGSWLKWLVVGIDRKNVGARTGYRWMIPREKNFASLLGCTMNNALASMLGAGSQLLVWGGSWAIQRKLFDSLGIRDAWNGVLSDDFVASRVLRHSQLAIQFEPKCVCTTRVQFSVATLFENMRGQFSIARRYATPYWLITLSVTILSQIGYWGGLFVGLAMLMRGDLRGLWFLGSSMLIHGLGIARALMRQNMGRMVTSEWRQYRTARKFDIASGPFTGLSVGLSLCASAIGSRVNLGGVRFDIGRGRRVLRPGSELNKSPWPVLPESDPLQWPSIGPDATADQDERYRRAA